MLTGVLVRYKRTTKETLGCLVVGGQMFYVLEPTWRENKTNVSCIPAGQYKVMYLPRSNSGKYKPCFYVSAVPNRLGILIHSGNIHKHTKGCLLLGTRSGKLVGNNAVLNSRYAMRKLTELIRATKEKHFNLEVVDGLVS